MSLYEADFYGWTQDTADRLRRNDFSQIDLAALVEEVEDMGKRQKSEIRCPEPSGGSHCSLIEMELSTLKTFAQLASDDRIATEPN